MSKTSGRSKPVTYDPDPTDLQMRILETVGGDNLTASDLANPQVVQILVNNQRVSLTQLKAAQAETEQLRVEIDQLRIDRENLRIRIATIESHSNAAWLEIPISILSGFAINMLTSDVKDGLGWFLLIISMLMLIYLRGKHLMDSITKQNSEGRANA